MNTCRCCNHPQRAALDGDLVAGVPHRTIADRYGVSTTSLSRHRSHVADLVAADRSSRMAELTAAVEELRQKALALLEQAEVAGDLRAACSLIREARASVEVLHKFYVDGDLEARLQRIEELVAERGEGWRRSA